MGIIQLSVGVQHQWYRGTIYWMGGQKRLIFVVIVAYREPLAKTSDSTIRLLADVNFDLDQMEKTVTIFIKLGK